MLVINKCIGAYKIIHQKSLTFSKFSVICCIHALPAARVCDNSNSFGAEVVKITVIVKVIALSALGIRYRPMH